MDRKYRVVDIDVLEGIARTMFHKGYRSPFVADEAPGAIPNGSRIVKAKAEPTDANPVGTEGKVLGSIYDKNLEDMIGNGYFYFVEWDSSPGLAVGIMGKKIRIKEVE